MSKHSQIKSCPITEEENGVKYFSLDGLPAVNNLSETREDSINAEKYPLNVYYYPSSGISCLDFVVDADLLFNHYLYKSEVNKPYYDHCKNMFSYAKNYLDIQDGTEILDIGGNDGTLLSAFKSCTDKKIKTLNIDPSKNLSEVCKSKGIDVITDFFTHELARDLGKKYSLVVCTNVFQHLKDLHSFVRGVETLLDENGIWMLEFPYWINSVETNQFDQVYHEHIYYHSVTPLKRLMEKHGLKIINVTRQDIHGGSLRLVMCKKDSTRKEDSTVKQILKEEESYTSEKYLQWGSKIADHIQESKRFIENLVKNGNTVFGFGAAAKGCVYLNAMKITDSQVPYIIDDTDLKQGKFVPGTGIRVVSRDILKHKSPDYILILAHNFSEYIIDSLKYIYKGKFIVLVPSIKIIDLIEHD